MATDEQLSAGSHSPASSETNPMLQASAAEARQADSSMNSLRRSSEMAPSFEEGGDIELSSGRKSLARGPQEGGGEDNGLSNALSAPERKSHASAEEYEFGSSVDEYQKIRPPLTQEERALLKPIIILVTSLGVRRDAFRQGLVENRAASLALTWMIRILFIATPLYASFFNNFYNDLLRVEHGVPIQVTMGEHMCITYAQNHTDPSACRPIYGCPYIEPLEEIPYEIVYGDEAASMYPQTLCAARNMSALLFPILFSFLGLSTYIWFLLYGRDFDELIPTHRAKVMAAVKNTAQMYLPGYIAVSILYVITVVAAFMAWKEKREDSEKINERPSFQMFTYVLYASMMIPYVAISFMFHVESIRLKYVTGDYCELLKNAIRTRRFDYALLTSAYMELEYEWSTSQKKFGLIGGLLFFGTAASVAGGCIIVAGSVVRSKVVNEFDLGSISEFETAQSWVPYSFSSPTFSSLTLHLLPALDF